MMEAVRNGAWAKSGYTAKDYVQDGLIAMWDGIENAGWRVHDPNATVWKDLSGNEYNATMSTIRDWRTNGLYMGTSTSANQIPWLNYTNDFYEAIKSGYSVEVAFKLEDGYLIYDIGGGSYFGSLSSNRFFGGAFFSDAFYNAYNQIRLSNDIDFAATFTSTDIALNPYKNHECVTLSNVWSPEGLSQTSYNGESVNKQYAKFKVNPSEGTDRFDRILIGAGGGQWGWNAPLIKHVLLCVRIYGRIITQHEIAANYAIDKARFNLP